MNEIFTRRSIRQFIDKEVEQDKIERILRAGMQAPSAHNRQPWEFVVIKNRDAFRYIADLSPYAKMVPEASVVIIVCANIREKNDKLRSDDWWVQDLSACTQNILLQITAEGLGGVWLGFYPDKRIEKVKEYFNLPEHIIPFSVIPFGYGKQENVFVDRYDVNKVHYETMS
jgi:nitroreductase